MMNRGRVRVGTKTIEFDVRRSARRKKTVHTTLDKDGVHIAVPSTMSDADIREIIRKRASWILENQSEIESRPGSIKLVTGDTLPYMGRDLRLVVTKGAVDVPEVRLNKRRLTVKTPSYLADIDDDAQFDLTRSALTAWYSEQASEHLRKRVDHWWPKLGRGERSRLLIRNQRTLWASCSYDGTLRINWRTMMLDPMLIDLIVVHELAHLTVRNHSAEFWNVVASAIPDVSVRRKRLREIGRKLPRWEA